MGLLDGFNEYVNPFTHSERERSEFLAREDTRRQQEAAAEQWRQQQQTNKVQPWVPQNQAAVGSANSGNPNVARWMGLYGLNEFQATAVFLGENGRRMPVGEYLDNLHRAAASDVELAQRAFFRAGFYGDKRESDITWGKLDSATIDAASGAVLEAARYEIDGRTGLADILERGAAGRAEDGGATSTRTVGLSTEGSAEANLRQAMEALLGRKPNSREVRSFHRRLNNAQKANPVVTTRGGLAEDDDGIGLDTDEVQDGGFAEGDIDKLAEEEILRENGVEANAYRLGGLTNAFESLMLGG